MSKKEIVRRKVLKTVMKKAWSIYKRVNYITFSLALKTAWKLVTGKIILHFSKIKGVTFGNRQVLLKNLSKYPLSQITLEFIQEKSNSYDPDAISIKASVYNKGAAIIGYLPQRLSYIIAPLLNDGKKAIVMLEDITGIRDINKSLGANVSYVLI